MQYDEFIQRVQEVSGVESRDEAIQATEAVFATLGERLYRTEQAHLAAQLPREIGEFLASRPPETTRGDVDRFTLEEFYNRVSARANTRYPQAVTMARSIVTVLQEAVSKGEIADIRQELSADFDELFQRAT